MTETFLLKSHPTINIPNFSKYEKTMVVISKNLCTFFSHAHLEAFFEATMLTLVAVVLVNWAISGPATLVS